MAKARFIESPEKFLEILTKCQLLSTEQLETLRSEEDADTREPVDLARALIRKGWLTKWQAGQLLAGFVRLKQDGFILCDQVGRGELGTVYLARHEQLGKHFTIKTLSKQQAAQPRQVEQFLGAARIATALEHRNLIRVHDVGSEGDRHYVVMDYFDGVSLEDRVNHDGPIASETAGGWIRQAAEGLAYAHAKGVVHHNVCPANLMVDDQGNVKLLDIGVGRAESTEKTPERNAAGAFLAPDADASECADVFGVGATLYYLLSGHAPIRNSENVVEVAADQFPEGVPESAVALCAKTMASKSEDRPRTMAEVVELISSTNFATEAPVAHDDDGADDSQYRLADEPADDASAGESAVGEPAGDELDEPAENEPADKGPADNEPADKGLADKGLADKGLADKGLAEKGLAEKGPAEKGPAEDGPAEDGPADKTARKSNATSREPAAKIVLPTVNTGADSPNRVTSRAAEFKIQTKVKKRRESNKPGNAGNSDAVKPETIRVARPIRAKLIFGIGGVALAVLLLGGALIAVLVSRGGQEKVAHAERTPAERASSAPVEPAVDLEAVPDVVEFADEGAGSPAEVPDQANEAPSGADVVTAAKLPVEPTQIPASGPGPQPGLQPGGAGLPPSLAGPSVSESPGGTPAATAPAGMPAETVASANSPASAATEPTTTSAANPTAEDTSTAPPAKEEPTPKPKVDKEPKKAKPAGPTFVFKPISIPRAPGENETPGPPFTLGKVNIAADATCFISLAGGQAAARGRAEFVLRNGEGGVAERQWDVLLVEGASETVIAQVALPKTDLLFQWTEAAADRSIADHLRNCSLTLTAGQDEPFELSLRRTIVVPQLAIDLTKPMSAKWEVDAPPDPSAIKIESKVAGEKYFLDPPGPMESVKGAQLLMVGTSVEEAVLMFKLTSSFSPRGVQVTATPHFKLPSDPQPVRLTKGAKRKYESLPQYREQVVAQREQLKAAAMLAKQQNKKPEQQRLDSLAQQQDLKLRQVDTTLAKLKELEGLEKKLASKGRLIFRVLYDTADRQCVLLETIGAPTADKRKR